MSSKQLRAVLIPSPAIFAEAIKVSESCLSEGALFVLGRTTNFPHLSLFAFANSGGIPPEEILSLISRCARLPQEVCLEAKGLTVTEGYIQVQYDATTDLLKLQDSIVKGLLNLARGRKGSEEEILAYPFIGREFHPHLTITRFFADRRDLIPRVEKGINHFSGSFTKLSLFFSGAHGECIESIVELPQH